MRKISNKTKVYILISVTVLTSMLFISVNASPDTIVQTNWDGGSGQSNYIDNSKFLSSNNINFNDSGEIKLTGSNPSWFTGWDYRMQLDVDETKVEGSTDLVNFPLLVDITSAEFITKAQSDGDDFVFTLNNGTTKLNHEIESYDDSTGHLIAWVKIPLLNATSNTTIYIYYGNALALNQESVENTWNSNYNMVMHLSETSGAHLDSTSNNNDTSAITVTTQGSAVGKINGTDDFSGNANVLTIPDSDSLDTDDDNFVFSFWFNALANNLDYQPMAFKGTNPRNYSIWLAMDEIFITWYSGNWRELYTTNANIQINQWYHVLYKRDGTNEYIYLNGDILLQQPIVYPMISGNENLYIGADIGFRDFDGRIDEIRFMNTSISTEFIKTEYNNMNDPASFYTLNSEEPYYELYESSGTLTSSIINSTIKALWGNVTLDTVLPNDTLATLKIRTSNLNDLSDAPDFSECNNITLGSDISSNNCINDYDQYIQYQLTLTTTDSLETPVVNSITIEYESDEINPVISDTKSSVLDSSAKIEWSSNELSSSKVKFGITNELEYITNDINVDSEVLNHEVILNGLADCQTFYFKPVATDKGGNITEGTLNTFKTKCNSPEYVYLESVNSTSQTVNTLTKYISYPVSYIVKEIKEVNDLEEISTNLPGSGLNFTQILAGGVLGSLITLGLIQILNKKKV